VQLHSLLELELSGMCLEWRPLPVYMGKLLMEIVLNCSFRSSTEVFCCSYHSSFTLLLLGATSTWRTEWSDSWLCCQCHLRSQHGSTTAVLWSARNKCLCCWVETIHCIYMCSGCNYNPRSWALQWSGYNTNARGW